MASASNTAQYSARQMPGFSDPYAHSSTTESFGATCSQSTPRPSCSYVHPDLPSNYPSKRSIRKPSHIELLDAKIRNLLQEKLIYEVLKGKVSDNLQFHRRRILGQLSSWLQLLDNFEDSVDLDHRDQFLNLIAGASKQTIKEIPVDNSEWTKLLNVWIRLNSSGEVIYNPDIYRFLAVDGFRGFRPKDLKKYLGHVLLPLRTDFRIHLQAVRAMYEYIETLPSIRNLTGTYSSCVVFWALLQLYAKHFPDKLSDDQLAYRVQVARSVIEGFLFQNKEYFRDVKNVNEDTLADLSKVYTSYFTDKNSWESVGQELITRMDIS